MILQIAWRNLWRHPRRTVLILLAVIVGVWSMLFYSAFIRGLAGQMVRQNIANLTGDLQIQAPGFYENPVLENLLRDPAPARVALQEMLPAGSRWTARLRIGGVLRSPRGTEGATVVGIVPEEERGVSFIADAKAEGALLPDDVPNGIVIGATMLQRLELRPGHRLVVDAQDANGQIVSQAFTIVGVFHTQVEATERQFVFCHRRVLQQALGLDEAVSELSVALPETSLPGPVAEMLRAELPAGSFRVLTWRELVPFVGAYLDSMGIFSLIWNIIIFVAMGFGLVNTILMAVFERIREIGLVRALGVTPWGVVSGVLLETLMLLVLGMALGSAAGAVSVAALHDSGIDFSAFAAGSQYFGMAQVIFPRSEMIDYVRAGATVIGLGLVMSLYPAVKAARITPIQAMAHV
jgi:ABC-type lipoprotein release transport system permease subunit